MTKDEPNTYKISRRKTLAALGTIGAASAGAGLGTSAWFSDRETFEDNTLTAGTLDLTIDWEEHYYNSRDLTGELDVLFEMPTGEDAGEYVGIPDPTDPLLWVHSDDLNAFMKNTAIEAFPDRQDDGVQDRVWMDGEDFEPCDDLASLPAGLESEYRTDGTVNDQTTNPGDSLVMLDDLKPGDFGELTLSFHLCDNDGFVWATGELVNADEKGVTEPEGQADAEQEGVVELLDEIKTALWYDDGDNVIGAGSGESATGKADIAFLMDRSGSMGGERGFLKDNITNVAGQIATSGVDANFALIPYEDGDDSCQTDIAQDLTNDLTLLEDAFDYATCGGTENASEAIQLAMNDLSWRGDAKQIVVVFTDEDDDGTTTQRTNALNAIDDAGACLLAVSPGGTADNDLQQMAASVECGDWVQITEGLSEDILDDLIGFVGEVTGGEEVIFRGSLREILNLLEGKTVEGGDVPYTAPGLPLDGGSEFDEIIDEPEQPAPGAGRGPFTASTTKHLGFAWWVPPEVGNEIQSDHVEFDLGFYAEQARHNSGAGLNTTVEQTTTQPTTTETTTTETTTTSDGGT